MGLDSPGLTALQRRICHFGEFVPLHGY